MSLLLGVDTGGTYTDAVIMDGDQRVLASAKSLTTREDLARGVSAAVAQVLDEAAVPGSAIRMAALSTTLATNALVEGQGEPVGLIAVGFAQADLDRAGLADALGKDPYSLLQGGHNHAGEEAAPLDETALAQFLEETGDAVTAYAVAGRFATRNPAHERRAQDLIGRLSGKPVTASHQLSAKLNGPKRAVTALLNARLVGMIDRLIGRAEQALAALEIAAPLMVVRGDGALMSAAQARLRPIETILSGPAASIVGARWLTQADTALVSDIGGTTTDVALLRDGRPAIDPDGARVGGFRTMVEAVAMRTTGLGGDSEVHLRSTGLRGGIDLGPRRLVPLSLIAAEAPDVVRAALETQDRAALPGEYDGRFVRAVPGLAQAGLPARDAALLARIGDGVSPLGQVLRNRMETGALARLVARGLVQVAGITPSDAAHVLGYTAQWDASAARIGLNLLARRRNGAGERVARDAEDMARQIIDALTRDTSLALLEAGFAEESPQIDGEVAALARHVLMQRGLAGHRGLLALDSRMAVPVIGLGASAATYYPAVGDALRCEMILPAHGGVANAIGAVVGQVVLRRSGVVTAPSEGRFRVHLDSGPEDFGEADAALSRLEDVLRAQALTDAQAAGASDIEHRISRDIRMSQVENREIFVEATLTVEASGRPRVATG